MARKASIRDVAAAAGLSAATVSKVLRGDPTVTEGNRSAVNDAVARLGYRIDPLAANLRRGQRSLLGVIVPDFENPFFGAILRALEAGADAAGLTLVAMSSWESPEREAALIQKMRDWRVAGLVIAPVRSSAPVSALLAEGDLRAVLIDRVEAGGGFGSVCADDHAGAAAIARHLAAAGHARVLLVASLPEVPNMQARIAGFRAGLAGAAPAGGPGSVAVVHAGLDPAAMEGPIADALAATAPTAVVSLFLPGLAATLAALRARGLRVPRDVSLASFDEADWLAVVDPPITAVAQPAREMGAEALALLLETLGTAEPPPGPRRLPCRFTARGSVAPPGTRP